MPVSTRSENPAVRSSEKADRAIEFELSAEDLLALSGPGAVNRPGPVPARAAHKRPWRTGAALALGVVLAALASGIAKREPSIPTGRTQTAASSRAEKPAASPTFPASASREIPVRFANPFDAVEVFEFPPGTSREYAREAVAEFLLDRAKSRHARHVHRSRTRLIRES